MNCRHRRDPINAIVRDEGPGIRDWASTDHGAEPDERIGRTDARLILHSDGRDHERTLALGGCDAALRLVFAVRIDAGVIAQIRDLSRLALLHIPANLLGVEVARQLAPHVPQVAVFDTDFHQQLPPHACTYALPLDLQRRLHVRRYGFHGSSHAYVAGAAARWLGYPLPGLRLITLHLGNGCSAAAVRDGRSVDTSMGFHADGGPGDGDALRRPRPGDPDLPGAQDGLDADALVHRRLCGRAGRPRRPRLFTGLGPGAQR